MIDRELMQMALDALEYAADEIGCPNDDDSIGIARKALRARLAGWERVNMHDHKEGDLGIGTVKWDASAPLVVHSHPAFQATPPQQPEQEPVATLFGSLPVYDVPPKQEPVAWMHNFIDEVVIAHRPVDLDRHPDRWTPLYKDPTPCQTCEALARTVMMDQVSYDIPPRHREPPTQDLSAPLTVNGVPMYPQREWQGLTDEEVRDLWSWSMTTEAERTANTQQHAFACAIEAKLKEKNNA